MIELRWVHRIEPQYTDESTGKEYGYRHKVLQYRQRHIPDSPVIGGPAPKWSDWIDVPEVSDE